MKALELRIGNWIIEPESDDKSPFKVWGVYCEKGNDKINGYPISYFKPIPLTEEWLLKFGFKKELLSDDSSYYYSLGFNENKYCDLSICSCDKNGFIEVTLFPYEDWFRYKYLHQLQNLYFTLTGEEL